MIETFEDGTRPPGGVVVHQTGNSVEHGSGGVSKKNGDIVEQQITIIRHLISLLNNNTNIKYTISWITENIRRLFEKYEIMQLHYLFHLMWLF